MHIHPIYRSLYISPSSAACGCWLHHWLGRSYAADAASPLPVHWCSFCRPQKDDRLSQPPGVLIQRPTGLELRTLGSQATNLTTKPTPGLAQPLGRCFHAVSPIRRPPRFRPIVSKLCCKLCFCRSRKVLLRGAAPE